MRITFAIIAVSLILLSGCAALDISTMDTAKPIHPQKVDVGMYSVIGPDASSLVVVEKLTDSQVYSHDQSTDPELGFISGVKLGIGVLPTMDIVARYYTGYDSGSMGIKAGVKQQLYHSGNHYLAFMPSYTYSKGTDYYFSLVENNNERFNCTITGVEGQLLYTTTPNDRVSYTLSARLSYSRYRENYEGIKSGPYDIVHGGIRTNMKMKSGLLYIMPELGIEFVPVVNGDFGFLTTTFGLGMGFNH